MYQLKAGLLKSKLLDSTYEEVDLSSYKVKDLLNNYDDAYLVLTHYAVSHDLTLRLSDAEALIAKLTANPTVTAWLTSVGDNTLPTVDGTPKVTDHYVRTRDAWQAGFSATLCVPVGSPFNDAPDSDKTDIWLTRDATDYVDMQKYCLPTVNGFVHRLDADNNGLYIKNGGETFRRSNGCTLGLMSFMDVGEVKTYPITEDMIYHPVEGAPLATSFYVKLPFTATDKVVGIAIGGYLHLLSNDVKLVGLNSIKVQMGNIPYLERYMESRYKMNQTAMEQFHQFDETRPNVYQNGGMSSDNAIKELLMLPQSFIVAVSAKNLSLNKIKTINTALPGRFYIDENNYYPLRTHLGLLPSYLVAEENGRYVLRVENNLHQQRVINTIPIEDAGLFPIIDEKRVSEQVAVYHRGDLMIWRSQEISIVAPD
jgi:hypothetical protein